MPETNHRRRIPVRHRRNRQPHPSPSPQRRTPPPAPRRSSKPSRPVKILKRCKSEPTLWTVDVGGDDHRNLKAPDDAVLFRPLTCTDIFSAPELLSRTPPEIESYNKDAKVVLNVTVEGSVGPIRTMVKLGSSVDETIRLVLNKYGEEGRSPQFDKKAASSFELHHSYFSLQSLNKSDVIGDVGSRSFYLRKNNSDYSSSGGEIVPAGRGSAPQQAQHFLYSLPGLIARKIDKIIRRARKLWNMLGCLNCGG
ncbi:uncharacterized protein At4g22758-like [Cornus florida]|uniref:uncharacterized protein At4g22758-like n=1 Tax=Cornus florida TaxID=4283 RepID=UPI002899D050|nr:uncharacterized protein At4g22758-like [Cornus florida]